MTTKSEAVERAEAYYDSGEADAFYQTIWGGQDIHIGLYADEIEPIADASRRTVETMATQLVGVDATTRILDLGAGYGGSARFLAERFGCRATCLNLSETQNDLNRKLTADAGLTDLVSVVYGDFENIPEPDDSFDIVWSQDAILHSGNRTRVLDEVSRVLVSGGQFIFTDKTEDLTNQLRMHYWRVGQALKDRYDEAVTLSGQTYVDNMIKGLQHWVDGADRGYLAWGIMDYRLSA